MFARFVVILAAAAVLSACERGAQPSAPGGAPSPELDAPAPDSEPSRVFAPTNEAASGATGEHLSVAMALRMPDAADLENAGSEVLTLRGANGLVLEAELVGVASPATVVEGQTVRALMGLPVEASQTFIYRVTAETKPENGQGLCGADAASHVLLWEPEGPGEPLLKIMGLSGAAPGESGARLCAALDYRRS